MNKKWFCPYLGYGVFIFHDVGAECSYAFSMVALLMRILSQIFREVCQSNNFEN